MHAATRRILGIFLISLATALSGNAQTFPSKPATKEIAHQTLQRIAAHKVNPARATGLERAIIKQEARRQIYGLADFLRNRNGVAEESEVAYTLQVLRITYHDVRAEIIATTPYKDRAAVSTNFLSYYPGFLELFELRQELTRR